jgi:hypothetical protein
LPFFHCLLVTLADFHVAVVNVLVLVVAIHALIRVQSLVTDIAIVAVGANLFDCLKCVVSKRCRELRAVAGPDGTIR